MSGLRHDAEMTLSIGGRLWCSESSSSGHSKEVLTLDLGNGAFGGPTVMLLDTIWAWYWILSTASPLNIMDSC